MKKLPPGRFLKKRLLFFGLIHHIRSYFFADFKHGQFLKNYILWHLDLGKILADECFICSHFLCRYGKRKLDNHSFFGGQLHVCYAPEYEKVQDTREKLNERRRLIRKKCQGKFFQRKEQLWFLKYFFDFKKVGCPQRWFRIMAWFEPFLPLFFKIFLYSSI